MQDRFIPGSRRPRVVAFEIPESIRAAVASAPAVTPEVDWGFDRPAERAREREQVQS